MRLSPPGTHFTAESTDAMQVKSLAQGENILMLRFKPATFVSKIDILTTTPIVHNTLYRTIFQVLESFGNQIAISGTDILLERAVTL